MNETIDVTGQTASNVGTVAIAFGLMLVHNLDEAFWHTEEGDGLISLIGVGAVAILTLLLYPRVGRRVRGAITGLLGALAAFVSAGGHIAHFFTGHVLGIDYSGTLFFVGGLLLVWVGWSNLRSR